MKKKNDIEKTAGCGEILPVGINYDKDKRHTCLIEKA